MKTKLKVFMLLCGIGLAAATLAPSAWPPDESPGPGPYTFDCPDLQGYPFDYASVRLFKGTYCVITCRYEGRKSLRISEYAPEGLCEATETGAIYN